MFSGEKDFAQAFVERVGKPLRRSVLLKEYSSFRIGGRADYFFEALSLEHLMDSFDVVRKYSLPAYIIGGGYNLLFDDRGYRGFILKNRMSGIQREDDFSFTVLSGTPLEDVLKVCVREGLRGFEFLAGIPGTVGGAVFGNAGAFGECIGSYLREALLLDGGGQVKWVTGKDLGFGYRDSLLKKTRDILLKSVFTLKRGEPEDIRALIDENIRQREKKHPPKATACAGSYFKNPFPPDKTRVAAAVLLEQIGAKELRHGGASVSAKHANFIVNTENASSGDVLSLAREMKTRVRARFGYELEEEVIFLPASP